MLEYTKEVLKKVSFNEQLFNNEVEKAKSRLTESEFEEIKQIFKIQ